MKKFKHLLVLPMAAVALVGLTACSSDDYEEEYYPDAGLERPIPGGIAAPGLELDEEDLEGLDFGDGDYDYDYNGDYDEDSLDYYYDEDESNG